MSRRTDVLTSLGLGRDCDGVTGGGHGETIVSFDPTTGEALGSIRGASREDYDALTSRAASAFQRLRMIPAPVRGHLVRRLGELFREHKTALGELIAIEVGKIRSEGLGEVQEAIDICELAVGMSRQLHGLTIASERSRHRMMEQWHPLGPTSIITAFNFPFAVWAWNAALAIVCGDPCVWKPSPMAPLVAVAVQKLCDQAAKEADLEGVLALATGGADLGAWMAEDARYPLVSFTGSIAVGRKVAATVAGRLGRSILELGGNNALIVLDDADLELAARAVTFGAVGTAGQRCTTTRRLLVQKGIAGKLVERLTRAYRSVTIGDPLDEKTLVGPVISARAVDGYLAAIRAAKAQGGEVIVGGKPVDRPGFFVEPTLVRAPTTDLSRFPIGAEETFAPILYVFEIDDVEHAIASNNSVTQGLSSAIFTDSVRSAERFLSPEGSDCGIANVNLGTSGAEIGGAFGGEKDTGGGRESGSDAWKGYMRRQTCTVNYGRELPLAQGVEFPV
jgi:aldehyde dehydrogenase (NAD+)